jgi:hypothetical protein
MALQENVSPAFGRARLLEHPLSPRSVLLESTS